jgi:peroxiredoxin Q/BCP
MGIERSTVVIGPDGTVTRVFHRVKPDQHAEQVLAALRAPAS